MTDYSFGDVLLLRFPHSEGQQKSLYQQNTKLQQQVSSQAPSFCKMRKCCEKKGIEGCWECDEFETCKKLDFLKPNHGTAHLKNLRKISKKGVEEFLKGKKLWYSPLTRSQ